jgi:hypothetical protein
MVEDVRHPQTTTRPVSAQNPSSGRCPPTLQWPWSTRVPDGDRFLEQNNVKHDGAAPNGPERMRSGVTARLRRLQRLPQIVRGFFGDPELAYITAVA